MTDYKALEDACRYALSQQADNICWMDLYTRIASVLGVEWSPTLLPPEQLRANCNKFIESIYSGCVYDQGAVSRTIQEHHDARQLLQAAGYGVTTTALLDSIRMLLDDVQRLQIGQSRGGQFY